MSYGVSCCFPKQCGTGKWKVVELMRFYQILAKTVAMVILFCSLNLVPVGVLRSNSYLDFYQMPLAFKMVGNFPNISPIRPAVWGSHLPMLAILIYK